MIRIFCMVFVEHSEVYGESDVDVHIFNEKRMERASQNFAEMVI